MCYTRELDSVLSSVRGYFICKMQGMALACLIGSGTKPRSIVKVAQNQQRVKEMSLALVVSWLPAQGTFPVTEMKEAEQSPECRDRLQNLPGSARRQGIGPRCPDPARVRILPLEPVCPEIRGCGTEMNSFSSGHGASEAQHLDFVKIKPLNTERARFSIILPLVHSFTPMQWECKTQPFSSGKMWHHFAQSKHWHKSQGNTAPGPQSDDTCLTVNRY